MKEMPVYALVVGKNGPKLKESDPEVSASPVNLLLKRKAGRNQNDRASVGGQLDGIGTDFDVMNGLFADRPVLDKTGLTGKYEHRSGSRRSTLQIHQ